MKSWNNLMTNFASIKHNTTIAPKRLKKMYYGTNFKLHHPGGFVLGPVIEPLLVLPVPEEFLPLLFGFVLI